MGVHVLNGLKHNIGEVYIDDMLIFGSNDDTLLNNKRTVFRSRRERNVTLDVEILNTTPFVGHDIDTRGINMSHKRIESTIDFFKPTSLKIL